MIPALIMQYLTNKRGKNPALLDETQEAPYLLENIPAIKKVEKTKPGEREKSEITPKSVSPENFLSSNEEKNRIFSMKLKNMSTLYGVFPSSKKMKKVNPQY